MFRLRKTRQIDCAHHLPGHDGKCKRPHGHTYAVTFELEGGDLVAEGPKAGMLHDYGDLGALMKQFVDVLDHTDLNAALENPTSELLCLHLHRQVAPLVWEQSGGRARLSAVLVSETPSTVAEYRQ